MTQERVSKAQRAEWDRMPALLWPIVVEQPAPIVTSPKPKPRRARSGTVVLLELGVPVGPGWGNRG